MNTVSKNLNSNITYKLFYFLVLVLFLRVDLVFENNTPTGGAVSYTHLTLPTMYTV